MRDIALSSWVPGKLYYCIRYDIDKQIFSGDEVCMLACDL